MAYGSLFISALIAATLFPLSSEALLLVLLKQQHSVFLLWLAATSGNTLGSCINWYLGKECLRWQDKKWFPIKPAQLAWAQVHFQHYGLVSLFFSWLPVVGDPLTFVAGVMRVRFIIFFSIVLVGKAIRYGVVISAVLMASANT